MLFLTPRKTPSTKNVMQWLTMKRSWREFWENYKQRMMCLKWLSFIFKQIACAYFQHGTELITNMLKMFSLNIEHFVLPETSLTCQLLLLMSIKLLISLSWIQFKHKYTKAEVVFSRICDKYNSIVVFIQ